MEIKKGKLLFFLCALCLTVTLDVTAQRTVPQLTGPVVDEAGILSEGTEQQIATLITTHEDSTSNQLAVLTISSLEGDELEEYSLRVARTWELGQVDKNNGVLVLVAVAERKIRIEVGYGLEGDLPDVTAKRIIDGDMTPYFRQGDFNSGVFFGVQRSLEAIEGTYEPSNNTLMMESLGMRLKAMLLLMVMPLLVIGRSILRPRTGFWVTMLFLFPFIFMAGFIVFPPFGGFIWTGIVVLNLAVIRAVLRRSAKWGPIMESIAQAKPGETITIDFGNRSWSYRIPRSSSTRSSSSGYSGGGYSSSSGYSGGGGSFGGGGASGGW